jgi:hypothetical protein
MNVNAVCASSFGRYCLNLYAYRISKTILIEPSDGLPKRHHARLSVILLL